MSLLKKYEKGEYKYASYNKLRSWIITLIMYALSAAIYTIGYTTTGSNKNLLTIVAILGVLPASKSLIGAIMSSRVRILDETIHSRIEDSIASLSGLYNLYLTSYDINFYIAHCVITKDSLLAYTTDKDFDNKRFDEHIKKHMKIEGIQDILIKVFDNEDAYINRLTQLAKSDQSVQTNEKLINLLKNISV
jgi:predicted transposase YbfD/YdcC